MLLQRIIHGAFGPQIINTNKTYLQSKSFILAIVYGRNKGWHFKRIWDMGYDPSNGNFDTKTADLIHNYYNNI